MQPESQNKSEQLNTGINEETLNTLFEQLRQDIFEEISGIKDLVNKKINSTRKRPNPYRGEEVKND